MPRMGLLPVTVELLAQFLHLPEGVSIGAARMGDDMRSVLLRLDGPGLPPECEVRNGEPLVNLNPCYRSRKAAYTDPHCRGDRETWVTEFGGWQ